MQHILEQVSRPGCQLHLLVDTLDQKLHHNDYSFIYMPFEVLHQCDEQVEVRRVKGNLGMVS